MKKTPAPKAIKRERPADLHGRQIVRDPAANPNKILQAGMKERAARKKMAAAHTKERTAILKSGKLSSDTQG